MASFLSRLAGKRSIIGRAVGAIRKAPIVGKALKMVPVVGTAVAAYEVFKAGQGLIGGGSGSISPMPSPPPLNLPAGPLSPVAEAGILPRGPGGSLQMPWNDPNVIAALKPFALDDRYLKVYYRAPKGYVVLRDADGKPFPCLKMAARKAGVWKQGAKAPISIGEWEAVKRADRTVKKIRRHMARITRVDAAVSNGKVTIRRRGKA